MMMKSDVETLLAEANLQIRNKKRTVQWMVILKQPIINNFEDSEYTGLQIVVRDLEAQLGELGDNGEERGIPVYGQDFV